MFGRWRKSGTRSGVRWWLWLASFQLCRRVSLVSVTVTFLAGQVVGMVAGSDGARYAVGLGVCVLITHWLVGAALRARGEERTKVLVVREGHTVVALCSCFVMGVIAVSQLIPRFFLRGEGIRVRGIVETIRRPQAGALQFRLVGYLQGAVKGAEQRVAHERRLTLLCQAADLPWRAASRVRVGDEVELVGTMQSFGGYDTASSYEKSLVRAGVDGRCKVSWLTFYRPEALEGDRSIGERIAAMIIQAVGDTESAALLLSMTLGTRDRLSRDTEDLFRFFGLSHLLVLSGYQLSQLIRLVGGVMTIVVAPLWRWVDRLPLQLVSPVVSGGIGAMLAAIAGFEVSITRALIGSMLVEVTKQQEGIRGMGHSLLTTALVMSALWPGMLFEPAGALTMSALIGIMVGSSIGGQGIRGVVGAHVGALLCTFAVSCIWFRPPNILAAIVAAPFAGIVAMIAFYGTLGGLGLLMTGIDAEGIFLRFVADGAEWVRLALLWMRGD